MLIDLEFQLTAHIYSVQLIGFSSLLEEILQYACVVGEKTGMDQKVLPMKYWKIQQQKFSELINKVRLCCKIL